MVMHGGGGGAIRFSVTLFLRGGGLERRLCLNSFAFRCFEPRFLKKEAVVIFAGAELGGAEGGEFMVSMNRLTSSHPRVRSA